MGSAVPDDVTNITVADGHPYVRAGTVITTRACREDRYSIHIVPDDATVLDALAREIGDRVAAIITDENVEALHARRLASGLTECGIDVRMTAIAPGEQSKNVRTACQLLEWLAGADFGRLDVLLAVGGGVVIDTAGWVASAYMRGIPYVNVPTTLLAQVDAAIGGKVAVNHPRAKNLIGAFYQPRAVVSGIHYLGTLSERQIRAGLAEVIKKAVIASPEVFTFLEQELDSILAAEPAVTLPLVHAASSIKTRLVERDPYEADLHRTLNFGHTVGHALETATGYGRLLHGEAVAFGMAVAVRIAAHRGLIDADSRARILGLIAAADLPLTYEDLGIPVLADDVLAAIDAIRQVRAGHLRFVLPTGIGSTLITDDVTNGEIRAALFAPTRVASAV
jgi:3-dehydroquinate synthase